MPKTPHRAKPHKTIGAPYLEFAPDSSLTGPGDVPGDEFAGATPVGLALDGIVAGGAELEGMLGEAAGVAVVDGPSDIGGAATGLLTGDATGVATGVATVGGGVAGDGTGGDPLLVEGLEAGG